MELPASDTSPEPPAQDSVTIETTVGHVYYQKPENSWKAFATTSPQFPSACGILPFDLERAQRVRLTGTGSEYRGKPQLLIEQAEVLPVEFANGDRLFFGRRGIDQKYYDRLVDALGGDFGGIIAADSSRLKQIFPRNRQASLNKILEAYIELADQNDFAAALRDCGAAEKVVSNILESRELGLRRWSPYDLIFDGGLSFREADKLAQTPYARV